MTGLAAPRSAWVYPRVGGGTDPDGRLVHGRDGLSPRGRGNRGPDSRVNVGTGSIPAWAGEPPASGKGPMRGRVYPRVGGGTKSQRPSAMVVPGLSPRGRGNRGDDDQRSQIRGSIPAWAGEPGVTFPSCQRKWVYPRVGGGTAPARDTTTRSGGLSPRGRGNR